MNLAIKNVSGLIENVVVVRYFKFNGGNYLIFTKNEVDEAGYQKLYISKVNNMIGDNISDEVEWNLIRDTIKVIAKANKENTTLPVQDMNEAEINGIQINGQKPFKLTSASVALLSANKNVMNNANVVTPAAPQTPIPNSTPIESTVNPMPETAQVSSEVVPTPVIPQQPVQPETPSIEPLNMDIPNMVAPVLQQSETTIAPNIVEPQQPFVSDNTSMASIPVGTTNISDVFEFPGASVQPVTPAIEPIPTVDYKKLYEEQTLKLNALTTELDKYKAIIEQLKNILQ